MDSAESPAEAAQRLQDALASLYEANRERDAAKAKAKDLEVANAGLVSQLRTAQFTIANLNETQHQLARRIAQLNEELAKAHDELQPHVP